MERMRCGWYALIARIVLAESDEGSAGSMTEFLQMDISLQGTGSGGVDFFLWHADAHADPFYQSETRLDLVLWDGRHT